MSVRKICTTVENHKFVSTLEVDSHAGAEKAKRKLNEMVVEVYRKVAITRLCMTLPLNSAIASLTASQVIGMIILKGELSYPEASLCS